MARRRRFEPSGLLAGLVFLTVAAGFACDAAGLWHPKPALVVPFVAIGMAAVAVVRAVTHCIRRHAEASTDLG